MRKSLIPFATLASISVLSSVAHAAGGWTTATSCNIWSTQVADQPRMNIFANKVVSETDENSGTARIAFSNIEPLSTAPDMNFSGVKIDTTAGAEILAATDASGKAAAGNYTLTIALPEDMNSVLSAIASGKDLRITVPTDGGEKTFTIDLSGSGKAIGALRRCLK